MCFLVVWEQSCTHRVLPSLCWLQQSQAQSPHCWVSKRAEPSQGNRVVGRPRLDLKPRAASCGYALHHLHFHCLLILNFPPLSMHCLAPPQQLYAAEWGLRWGRLAWGPLQLISRVAMTKVAQLFLFPPFLELLKISCDSRRNLRAYVRAFFLNFGFLLQGLTGLQWQGSSPRGPWALHPSPSQQGAEGICWDTSGTQHCGPLRNFSGAGRM